MWDEVGVQLVTRAVATILPPPGDSLSGNGASQYTGSETEGWQEKLAPGDITASESIQQVPLLFTGWVFFYLQPEEG